MTRGGGWTRPAALAAALVAAAACGDVLAPRATGPASLAVALQPAGPAAQQAPGTSFDEVDGLSLRVTRGNTVVIESTFSVTPATDEIRRSVVIWLERDEEELGVTVQLLRRDVALFAGSRPVRLARGRHTTAALVVEPVDAGLAGPVPSAGPP